MKTLFAVDILVIHIFAIASFTGSILRYVRRFTSF